MDSPPELYIPRREPTDVARRAKLVAGIEAKETDQRVAFVVAIGDLREEVYVVVYTVLYGVVVAPLLVEPLEGLGDEVGLPPEVKEDTVVEVRIRLRRANVYPDLP